MIDAAETTMQVAGLWPEAEWIPRQGPGNVSIISHEQLHAHRGRLERELYVYIDLTMMQRRMKMKWKGFLEVGKVFSSRIDDRWRNSRSGTTGRSATLGKRIEKNNSIG